LLELIVDGALKRISIIFAKFLYPSFDYFSMVLSFLELAAKIKCYSVVFEVSFICSLKVFRVKPKRNNCGLNSMICKNRFSIRGAAANGAILKNI
jgi:hypothetical protein